MINASANAPRAVGLNVMVSVSEEPTLMTRFVEVGEVVKTAPFVSGLEEIVSGKSGPTDFTRTVLLIDPPTRRLPKSREVGVTVIPFMPGAAPAVKLPII